MGHAQTLEVFYSLQPGDRVEVAHVVKVGFRSWNTQTVGTVLSTERQRHSLHTIATLTTKSLAIPFC